MSLTPLYLLSLLFLLTACSTSSHSNYQTTNRAHPTLIKTISPNQDPCKAQYSPTFRVLQLQGKQLYDCLKFQPKALVYQWDLKQDSLQYPSIEKVQHYCDHQGIRLYVVAAYYNASTMKKEYALDYPIIGIQTSYYQSDNPAVYQKSFLKDLGIILEEVEKGRLHYFENGNYRGAYKLLDSI